MSLKNENIDPRAVEQFIMVVGRLMAGLEFLPTTALRPPALTDVIREVLEDTFREYRGVAEAEHIAAGVRLLLAELERSVSEARPDMERLAAAALTAGAEQALADARS